MVPGTGSKRPQDLELVQFCLELAVGDGLVEDRPDHRRGGIAGPPGHRPRLDVGNPRCASARTELRQDALGLQVPD